MNTLPHLNMLRENVISEVRTPSGIRFMGAARASAQDKAMMNRMTQTELDTAMKWQMG